MQQLKFLFSVLTICLTVTFLGNAQTKTVMASTYTLDKTQGVITSFERNFLQNFLNANSDELIATIKGASAATWYKKPALDQWSMSQCLTHIIQAENAIFAGIKKTLQKTAEDNVDLRAKDAWLISKIADRGRKVKTPLNNAPKGLSQKEGIAMLLKSRKAIKEFLSNETLPLRNHFGKSPYGKADAYQLFLVIATHGARHHAQMAEAMKMVGK